MAKRGRPSKPAGLNERQGNPGHRKAKPPPAPLPIPDPVEEDRGPLAAPKWLSRTAATVWRELAPTLRQRRLLQDADVTAFGRYCDWLARYVALARKTTGNVVEKSKSKKALMASRVDRAITAMLAIDKTLSHYEDRFGMNPRERMAIYEKMMARPVGRPPSLPRPGNDDAPAAPAAKPATSASPIGFLRRGALSN